MRTELRTPALLACTLLSISAVTAPPLRGQDTLYYSRIDGSVRGVSLATGAETRVVPSARLGGVGQGAARQIAFDATARRLWYTGANGVLQSLDPVTLVPGPSIAQGEIPGGFSTRARRLSVDNVQRRLFVSLRTGGVAIFRLAGLRPTLFGTIPASAFVGANPRELRRFAVDARTGNLWYPSSDGVIRELSVGALRGTGRFIARAELPRGGQGVARSFVIDPVRDLLVYASTTGGVEAVNLTTLRRDPFALRANVFINPGPGVLRALACDVLALPGSVVSVGSSCRGTVATPLLSAFFGRVPVVGRSFVIRGTTGAVGAPAALQIGVLGSPRPVLGAPGCTRYVLPFRVVPLTNRFGIFATPIPRDPSLVGRETSYQLIVPDPNANAAGRTYSNALRTVVGTHAPAFTFRRP